MAQRSVLNGRYAEASLGGVLIALLYDWEATVEGKVADATAHGDSWEYKLPLQSTWKFRAKGYVVPASASHYIKTLWAANTLTVLFTVAGFSGTVASGTKIFEGQGYPIKGIISASMELATQEWEIQGHGAPSVGVT